MRVWGLLSSSNEEDRPVLAFVPLWGLSRLLSGEGGRGRGRESAGVDRVKEKEEEESKRRGKSSKAIILEGKGKRIHQQS